jgi:hypothetical protein
MGGTSTTAKKSMDILGVIFYSKLGWLDNVASTILKANHSLNALKIICKHFKPSDLIKLVTRRYFSVLI